MAKTDEALEKKKRTNLVIGGVMASVFSFAVGFFVGLNNERERTGYFGGKQRR